MAVMLSHYNLHRIKEWINERMDQGRNGRDSQDKKLIMTGMKE